MHFAIGNSVDIQDSDGRQLGTLEIEGVEDELLLGKFISGPDYARVQPLFRQFEELVNHQVFTLADQAGEEINRLQLQLKCADGHEAVIRDVQIWSDGGMSCRLRDFAPGEQNGIAAHTADAHPVVK